jgi:hypothetical protein
MAYLMKTTADIPKGLLAEAQNLARCEGTTLNALIQEGLQQVVADRKRRGAFRLRKASFRGEGLQDGFEYASWGWLRELAYKGRGN